MGAWFVHPWLLTLLATLGLLWWLPRWMRRPERLMPWGARRWLEAAIAQNRIEQRWHQSLLWLRALVIIAVCLAAAIPRWDIPNLSIPSHSATERTWWIIVIDDGPNAHYVDAVLSSAISTSTNPTVSRFAQGIEQARQLIESSSPHDAFSLVGTTDDVGLVLRGPSNNRDLTLERLSQWNPRGLLPSGSQTLRKLNELVDDVEQSGETFDQIEVVFFSSRESIAWQDLADAENASMLKSLESRCHLSWRDWGSVSKNNIAITEWNGIEGSLLVGQTRRTLVRIANRDQTEPLKTKLLVRLGGRPIAEREISLAAGATAEFPFEITPTIAGQQIYSIETSQDACAIDSIQWRVVSVIEKIDLVILSDDPREQRSWSALAGALRDHGMPVDSVRGLATSRELWSPESTFLIVGRWSPVDSLEWDRVRRFLQAGGNAWIACGPEHSPARWCQLLELPECEWEPVSDPNQTIEIADAASMELQSLKASAREALATTPVWRRWQPRTVLDLRWSTELRQADQPLMISARLGRGSLGAWLSSWGAEDPQALATADQTPTLWSAFSLWPSFPAIAQQWITHQVGQDARRHQVLANMPIEPSRNGSWNWIASIDAMLSSDLQDASSTPRPVDEPASFRASLRLWTMPGVVSWESDSAVTQRISLAIHPQATEPITSTAPREWSDWSAELPQASNAAMTADSNNIATSLALGLLALVLLESWWSRSLDSRSLTTKSNRAPRNRLISGLSAWLVLSLLLLLTTTGLADQSKTNAVVADIQPTTPSVSLFREPSSLFVATRASLLTTQDETNSLPTDADEEGVVESNASNQIGTAGIERVVWLRTWKSPIWQPISLGLLVWGASLWLTRTSLTTQRGIASATIRGLLISLLLYAAQGWHERRLVEQPNRVQLVLDLSASMGSPNESASDSIENGDERTTRLGAVMDRLPAGDVDEGFWQRLLGEQRRVEWYSLGDRLRPYERWSSLYAEASHPEQQESRLESGIEELLERNAGRSVSAIIFATDGLSTETDLPRDLLDRIRLSGVPWFPVVVGQDSTETSVQITTQGVPSTAFVGESLLLNVVVSIDHWQAGAVRLELLDQQSQQPILTRRWTPNESDSQTFSLPYAVTRSGPNQLTLRIVNNASSTLLGEERTERFEAIEYRSRVLVISAEPTLEFRFLKHALERAMHPGSNENRMFAVSTWIQMADSQYVDTDESAIRSFPADDAQLSEFDVVVLIDPLLADQDSTRGLSRGDLERLQRHVESDAAGMILVTSFAFDPERFRGTALERFFPCSLDELEPWEQGSGSAAQLTPLQLTPLSINYAALRDDLAVLRINPSMQESGEIESFDTDREASESRSLRLGIPFQAAAAWFATQLRPGVRPLLVATDSTDAVDTRVALTQQNVGRGLVTFQGFADAYRLRYRASDQRADRYWIQSVQQLARHRWLDQHPRTLITADRNRYREGETAWLSVTAVVDGEGQVPMALVSTPDGSPREIELQDSGAGAGWYTAAVHDLLQGTYVVSIEGTGRASRASIAIDVLAARNESDPLVPDRGWLKEIAEASGGKIIEPQALTAPKDWLPVGDRSIIAMGLDRPIWDNRWVVWSFAVLMLTLLFLDWQLRSRSHFR